MRARHYRCRVSVTSGRALDAVAATLAAVLPFLVIRISGYFTLLLMPLALAIGLPLVWRLGRRRWVGGGVLIGLVAVLLAVVTDLG